MADVEWFEHAWSDRCCVVGKAYGLVSDWQWVQVVWTTRTLMMDAGVQQQHLHHPVGGISVHHAVALHREGSGANFAFDADWKYIID
jgi:hypothetical protein